MEEVKGRGRNKGKSMHVLYLDVNSIVKSSKDSIGSDSDGGEGSSHLEEKDCELIAEIAKEPDPFLFLVHSLCPAIFGHEMVKGMRNNVD